MSADGHCVLHRFLVTSSTCLKSVNRRSIVGASAYYFSNVMLILLIIL